MGSILKFILAVLLLFIVITIAAFVYLPWWGALLVVLGMVLAIVGAVQYVTRNLGKMLGKAMIKAFDLKARVLRDAGVTVNHVEATLAPAKTPEDEDDEQAGEVDQEDEQVEQDTAAKVPLAYYRIDVTITPRLAGGEGMTHWDVDDLRVVPFDSPRPSLDLLHAGGEMNQGYDLQKIQIQQDGQFIDDREGKHEGTRQLRATVGVPMHVRKLKFQYYTEQFGSIDLPQPLPQLA